MTEQQKPDLSQVEPVGNWADEEEPRRGPSAADAGRGTGMEPIPGTPGATSLVDEPAARQEPRTSPETEHELDQLRRDGGA